MRSNTFAISFGLAVLALVLLAASPLRAEDVKVTVLAVLATTDKNATVDPELAAIAELVRKTYPNFTGFRKGRTTCLPLKVGQEESFSLVDDQKATISIMQGKDKRERIRVQVKPPMISELLMSCCTGKFVPFVTPYETKEKNERLIIAVMVNPCPCP